MDSRAQYINCLIQDSPEKLPEGYKNFIQENINIHQSTTILLEALNGSALQTADYIQKYSLDNILTLELVSRVFEDTSSALKLQQRLNTSAVVQLYFSKMLIKAGYKTNPTELSIDHFIFTIAQIVNHLAAKLSEKDNREKLIGIYTNFLQMESGHANAYIWCAKQIQKIRP